MTGSEIVLSDYLLDQATLDWSLLLRGWDTILPAEIRVWLVNLYGDIVFADSSGAVSLLDVGGCSVRRLADSREEFEGTLTDSIVDDVFLVKAVDECRAAGLSLRAEECFSFIKPPLMGGSYAFANTRVLSVDSHYRWYANFHRQTQHLPDGTHVQVVPTPKP